MKKIIIVCLLCTILLTACSNTKETKNYNIEELEKILVETELECSQYDEFNTLSGCYNKKSKTGIAGCKNQDSKNLITCQIAMALTNGTEFSLIESEEYRYNVQVHINGKNTTIWINERPNFDWTPVLKENESSLNSCIDDPTTFKGSYDEETKTGISGCTNTETDNSIQCQIAKSIGANEKFSTIKQNDYYYSAIATINEEKTEIWLQIRPAVDKPVIYLYPEETAEIKVSLKWNNGFIKTTYPKYRDKWIVTATPEGLLTDNNGRNYDYLFYDGILNTIPEIKEGFVVKKEDLIQFLEKTLSEYGLTEKEANEFIIYWLPLLEENEYNLISFQNEWFDKQVELNIDPTPDTIFRLFMIYKPLNNPIKIKEQIISPFERKGFTVVEWGGTKLN